jgi:hypothetical protein
MELLSTKSDLGQRTIRGREKRNITLNTKLTESEFAEVVKFCETRQIAFGEWVRELVLRELRDNSGKEIPDPILSEVVGIRLLLVNLLRPQATGQTPFTAIGFESLLEEIKKVKRQVALDIQRDSTGENNR